MLKTDKVAEPKAFKPFVPASTHLPEITVKAVLLAVLLTVILAGANAYLGLFAGMTVSASIPAAVISMGILRLFKKSNILENNIVQTCASAGEALAAGVIFTLPALVLLGTWKHFDFLQTTLIAGLGGILGVLFTVPLRRALIVEQPLQFPEGIACAEVLETGERGGSGVKLVAGAAIVSALFKLSQTGFMLWNETAEWAAGVFGGKSLFYIGGDLSPALVAVGYIVGLNIALLVLFGGLLNFWVAIPLLTWLHGGVPAGQSAADYALSVWSSQTRYLGVGAMVVGGLWALVRMRGSVFSGIASGLAAYRRLKDGAAAAVARTDRDIPMQWVLAVIAASVVPLFLLYRFLVGHTVMSLGMAAIMVVFGFLFSAVSGYMTGLVGSSNNPVSGVTIATMLFASLLLLGVFGATGASGAAAAILIGAVVCCAAAIAGDNLHDLKTGYLVGATPWKQQVMLIVGVVVSAVVMAPILNLLLAAYGIGPGTAAHPNSLAAPQAALMAAVAKGVFEGGLPWTMVFIGMGLAVAIIALDLALEKRGAAFRTPVLAVAVGIYLPLELSTPMIVGGIVAHLARRALAKRSGAASREASSAGPHREMMSRPGGALTPDEEKDLEQRGLLLASGLITGEALVGILLAVPIVLAGRSNVLAIFGSHASALPGLALLALIVFGFHRLASPAAK